MTQPIRRPDDAHPDGTTPGRGDLAGLEGLAGLLHLVQPGPADAETLSPARARHTNAHRAGYAAAALQHHARLSSSHADTLETALTELLTDIHHLCDTCDLDTDLATLFKAAALIHTRETQPS
ncbi:hypothetical protein [Kineococcus sp. SYSU DK001]|uniref:hypothetical protein n=1 Tax=Kineococcus sp. SYSU DK001 TaxID=3383122 RepID=UPI003D7C54C8